jgi:hypothetical protein
MDSKGERISDCTMAFHSVTLENLPKIMIPVALLRSAFEKCTPFDCPSRISFAQCYPAYSWVSTPPDDIPMKFVSNMLVFCLGCTDYLDRFALFFAGEQVAPYEVLLEYFSQAFVRT